MSEEVKVNCAAPRCGEEIEENYGEYSNILEDQICSACWQSDTEHASAITLFTPIGEVSRIILGDLVALDSEYGEPVDASTWKREWRASSAWRGHYDTVFVKGWTEVEEDLLLWGERTEGQDLGVKIQAACEDGTLPCEVTVIADPTSNLFAQGISFWVRDEDAMTFAVWVKGDAAYAGATSR
jgi:hypothetical protein